MQFEGGAFPESSQALLLTTAFEDEDDDEYEDETSNAERLLRADLLWTVFPALKAWAVLSGHFMANWRTPTVKDLSDYCFG
jgi:hypothetical protein